MRLALAGFLVTALLAGCGGVEGDSSLSTTTAPSSALPENAVQNLTTPEEFHIDGFANFAGMQPKDTIVAYGVTSVTVLPYLSIFQDGTWHTISLGPLPATIEEAYAAANGRQVGVLYDWDPYPEGVQQARWATWDGESWSLSDGGVAWHESIPAGAGHANGAWYALLNRFPGVTLWRLEDSGWQLAASPDLRQGHLGSSDGTLVMCGVDQANAVVVDIGSDPLAFERNQLRPPEPGFGSIRCRPFLANTTQAVAWSAPTLLGRLDWGLYASLLTGGGWNTTQVHPQAAPMATQVAQATFIQARPDGAWDEVHWNQGGTWKRCDRAVEPDLYGPSSAHAMLPWNGTVVMAYVKGDPHPTDKIFMVDLQLACPAP